VTTARYVHETARLYVEFTAEGTWGDRFSDYDRKGAV